MRGGGTRGGPYSAWTVARLQRIGNWGRADEALGRRWEHVGLLALASLLNEPRSLGPRRYTPTAILALADSEALRREVHASGLRNPDASLIGALPTGNGILQPVDFKWSLERAELPQVNAATIERLLDADLPGVQALLGATRIAAGLPGGDLEYVDGFFFAPDHAENRAYLASAANARAEFPLGPTDVLLWTVEQPSTFFAPLDGWELGRWLAEMDRSGGLLETLEGAERYFRLGAGFAGALVRLQTPLFADEPATVEARAELSRLRTTRRLYTSVDLAGYLERLMAGREALERELRDLESSLYPFRQFRVELAARKPPAVAADGMGPGFRERYRVIRAAIRARLRQEGRKLVSEGQTEVGALSQLKSQGPQLAKLATGIARRVLAAEA
jgi:hypothetical protein